MNNKYPLKEFIKKTLFVTKNYKELTKVQEELLPFSASYESVLALAKTGCGKTDAFLIPLMSKINPSKSSLQAIIITPTRELADQINSNISDYIKNNESIKSKLIIGGDDRKKIMESKTIPHILTITPQRVKDLLIDNSLFALKDVSMLVLDEVDMLIKDNYLEDIDLLREKLNNDIQILGFSASFDEHLLTIYKKYFKISKIIKADDIKNPISIKHYAIKIEKEERLRKLVQLIKTINPYLAVIFVSKKENIDEVYENLAKLGYPIVYFHGDLESRKRKKLLKEIREDKYQLIIASDLFSRGIDLEGVSEVISYDLPNNLEFYFHRAGRSGRMDKEGSSYFFYTQEENSKVERIRKNAKINFVQINKNGIKEIEVRAKRNTHSKELANKIKKATGKKVKVSPNYKKKLEKEKQKIVQRYNKVKRRKK